MNYVKWRQAWDWETGRGTVLHHPEKLPVGPEARVLCKCFGVFILCNKVTQPECPDSCHNFVTNKL